MQNQPEEKRRHLKLSSHIRMKSGSEGGTVLDLRKNRCYHLNAIGCVMLQELVDGKSVSQVVRLLAAKTSADPDRIAADVERFIATLLERNWIVDSSSDRDTSLLQGLKRMLRRGTAC